MGPLAGSDIKFCLIIFYQHLGDSPTEQLKDVCHVVKKHTALDDKAASVDKIKLS